jgi:hypothetical protein
MVEAMARKKRNSIEANCIVQSAQSGKPCLVRPYPLFVVRRFWTRERTSWMAGSRFHDILAHPVWQGVQRECRIFQASFVPFALARL